jgi:hypothetical protein
MKMKANPVAYDLVTFLPKQASSTRIVVVVSSSYASNPRSATTPDSGALFQQQPICREKTPHSWPNVLAALIMISYLIDINRTQMN